MTTEAILCIIIFILVLVGFVSRKFPMGWVAMTGFILMVLCGCIDSETALSYFGNSNVVLLGGLFIISASFTKTVFVGKIATWMAEKSRGSLIAVAAGYVLLEVFLSQFINSTAGRFCMVYPLAIASAQKMKVSPSRLVYPVAVASMTASGILPTTSAVAITEMYRPQLIVYGLEQYADFSVISYGLSRLSLCLIIIPLCIFYLPKHLPDRIPVTNTQAGGEVDAKALLEQKAVYTPLQEKLVCLIFLLTCLGFAFNTAINTVIDCPIWMVCTVGALICIGIGAMRGTELYNNMGLSVIFVVLGAMGIGAGLSSSGAAAMIGDVLVNIFGEHPNGYLVGLVAFLGPCILGQFITNIPAVYTFIPIIMVACKAFGGNPVGPLFLILNGSMAGYVAPTANVVASMMYGLGDYTMGDIAKKGIPLIILGALVCTGCVMTMIPFYS